MPAAAHSIISRVSPENRWKLETPIGTATAASLMAISNAGLLRPVIPPDHEEELVNAGYAERVLGGLRLTDTGQVRAQMELGE
jgi:hypothetical protein